MLRFIALQVLELLLQLENKQQIMQINVQNQHKHRYLLYIGICYILVFV